MKKKATRFLIIFLCAALVFCGVLSFVAFAFDPQDIFRKNNFGKRVYSPRFSAAGAAKNYDYDMAVIGSSMVQNFDASFFAEKLGCKPLKLTLGALTPGETLFLYDYVRENGKADKYIINIDLHRIAAEDTIKKDAGRFPEYLFDSGFLSAAQYLLSYETWFRFMAADLAVNLAQATGLVRLLPESYSAEINRQTDINAMCSWDESNLLGERPMIRNFLNDTKNFNEGDNLDFSESALENMREFFDLIATPLKSDETLIFYLPPYSSIYWIDKTGRELETLVEMRGLLAQLCDKRENVYLYDFQAMPETLDLTLYYDSNHCGSQLRLKIQDEFAKGAFSADAAKVNENSQTIKIYREKMRKKVYG